MTDIYLERVLGIDTTRRNFRCPNPDHEDRSPSAWLDTETRGAVHCAGCGRTWSVFQLDGMLCGTVDFREQVQHVADVIGFRLSDGEGEQSAGRIFKPRKKKAAKPPDPLSDTDISEHVIAASWRLLGGEDDAAVHAMRYLADRGFDTEDVKRHGLGYVPTPERGMPGFGYHRGTGRGFVTVPYPTDQDVTSICYCIMRTVGTREEIEAAGTEKEFAPKGIKSPIWREYLLREGVPALYVTEAIFDAIALEKMTGKRAIALRGTASGRLESVLHYTPAELRPAKVVIAMDNDDSGKKAAATIAETLNALGIPHADMPPYPGGAKDANDWLMASCDVIGPDDDNLYRTVWR